MPANPKANRGLTEMTHPNPTQVKIAWPASRLRRHADYQRVYAASRKHFAKQMSYFFAPRPALGPDGASLRGVKADAARVGLTVGKAMGNAVHRNRIKRRMREVLRRHLGLLPKGCDLILHPRRSVLTLEFTKLDAEVVRILSQARAEAARMIQSPVSLKPAV